jgi:hypothetical protein
VHSLVVGGGIVVPVLYVVPAASVVVELPEPPELPGMVVVANGSVVGDMVVIGTVSPVAGTTVVPVGPVPVEVVVDVDVVQWYTGGVQ